MSRTEYNFGFDMTFELKFKTAIRGHHEYKATWTPVMNEMLKCMKDNRQEAIEYDPNAVGVYKETEHDTLELAGHVPIEISRLIAGFLGASEMNSVSVQVCGRRKREVGLIVPGCYIASAKRRKFTSILSKELKDVKERYPYFDFELVQDMISKPKLKKAC